MTKFAIYVCPTGSLAEQIQRFLAEHRETLAPLQQGPDACCMLIEGFEEQSGAAPVYTRSLDRAYNRGLKSRPSPVVTLDGLVAHSLSYHATTFAMLPSMTSVSIALKVDECASPTRSLETKGSSV